MSATILGGDITIYFSTDNEQLRTEWSGSAAGTRTVNEYYSASKTLEALSANMSERIWVTAQTPVDYTWVNGHFGDDTTTEHLTGATIQSSGWGSGVILKRGYDPAGGSAVDFIGSDIGKTITGGTTGDEGTLLDYNNISATPFVVIRADVSGPANDAFDNDTETLSVVAGGGTGNNAADTPAVKDGETVWANPNTISPLSPNTKLYAYQSPAIVAPFGFDDRTKVIAAKGTDSWWGEGNIDILLKVQEADVLLDEGYASFWAHQFGQTYSHAVVDLSAGARTPIALETQNDPSNFHGTRQLITNAETGGGWTSADVGVRINENIATPTKEAVLTSVTGTGPNYTMQYILVADQTDFVTTDLFEDLAATKTATIVGAPTLINAEASPSTTITVTHGNILRDMNNGNGTQPYSAELDAQQVRIDAQSFAENVYELSKWALSRGVTATGLTDGIEGEQFVGNELHLNYSGLTGAFVEGEQLWLHDTGNVLVATGIVVADHGAGNDGGLQFRNVRNYTTNTITQVGDNVAQGSYTDFATTMDDPARFITPVKAAPFGTLAGGTFFAAPGVWLTDLHASDAQAIQLIDDTNGTQDPPNTVAILSTNLVSGDTVTCYRRVDGTPDSDIDRAEYNPNGTQGPVSPTTVGILTLTVTGTITNEAPDVGWVKAVDVSNNNETLRYRYSSLTRASGIFTFTGSTGTADATSTVVQLFDAAADFVTDGVEVGDICRNTTDGEEAIVVSVDDLNTLQTIGATSTWDAKVYEVNYLARSYVTGDDVWVPFIDEVASTTFAQNSIIHTVDIPVRFVVRNAGVIEPQSYDALIESGGVTQPTIRGADTIFTP